MQMWGYLAIHAKRWDYRPSPEAVTALIEYLQSQGIIGPAETGHEDAFSIGPKCDEELGFDGIYISIRSTPHLQIGCGPLEVACKHCGAEIADWPELFSQFFETDEEPTHECADCGAKAPVTQLDYRPGAAFGYFVLTVAEPGADEPNTKSPVWAEMERILGTELAHTYYML